ncbi:MAG: alpha/beta fold hydrolase [Bacteroidales bacterium]|nr:alpha/beta fold hydrolase [Bacteroidales bacterium]
MGISDLHFTKLGSGHPLIILHGLYGSGSNWLSIARKLAGICEVYLLDQRNHGKSPHFSEHNYKVLMEDLLQFIDARDLSKVMLLGHSMGGKTAMFMATHYPERVSRLVVADMSPLSYIRNGERADHFAGHEHIMTALKDLDLSDITNHREADEKLEAALPDRRLRQFLMKNLTKTKEGNYYWQINLDVLMRNLDSLADGLNPEDYQDEGFKQYPVLFVKGENSHYIGERDEKAIKRLFPGSNLVSIRDAGHWLHAEQPEAFVKIIKKFLLEY